MTTEKETFEAQEILKEFRKGLDSLSEYKLIGALDMAIEALNHSEIPNGSGKDTNVTSNNILRHPSCKNRTSLGNCDPVGGFCSSVPKDMCAKYYVSDTNVGDMISRQNTITSIRDYMVNPKEAISEHPDDILKYNSGLLSAVQAVNDMPSAQSEIIQCKDCKYNGECSIQFVANADDKFFCGAGERWT